LLTTGAATVADDLERYGESTTAAWMLTCSEEELVRVCTVADWLLYNGPARSSGASMLIAKACALAAVYVHEGRPRDLARLRRAPLTGPPPDSSWRRPDPQLHQSVAPDYGVGEDARACWESATTAGSVNPRRTVPSRKQEPAPKAPRTRNPPGPAALLAKSFDSTMANKLSTSGFVRRAQGLLTITLNEHASGWLALPTTTYRGNEQVFVTPNVVVAHREIARVMNALDPDTTPLRYQATVATPLTALVPGASSNDWIYEEGPDFEPRTSELAAAVHDYALAFMHRYEDLGQIIVGLRQKLGGPPEAATKKLAIALLLHGDKAAALSELDLFGASIADRTDPAANHFRAFDQALRRYTAAQ
jgi:hypothetical protein